MEPPLLVKTHVNIGLRNITHHAVRRSVSTKAIAVVLSHVLWLLSVPPCGATTIVAISTNRSVYIGADSRGSDGNAICKLIEGNAVAVGISGHLFDSGTGFDAAEIINGALSTSADIQAIVDAIELPLAKTMAWGRQNAEDEYRLRYDGKRALGVMIVSAKSARPQITTILWSTKNGTITRDSPNTLRANSFNAIGTFDDILAFIRNTPKWAERPAIDRIRTLLNIESLAQPLTVGPPVSILKIDDYGVTWLERGACEQPAPPRKTKK